MGCQRLKWMTVWVWLQRNRQKAQRPIHKWYKCYLQICPFDFTLLHSLKRFLGRCTVVWNYCLWVVFVHVLSHLRCVQIILLTKLRISIQTSGNIPSPCSFPKPGQWRVTHSMIVSAIVLQKCHLDLSWVSALVWPDLIKLLGIKHLLEIKLNSLDIRY